MEPRAPADDHLPMTRLTIVEKPPAADAKDEKVRRYFIVRLHPKHDHLRKAHD